MTNKTALFIADRPALNTFVHAETLSIREDTVIQFVPEEAFSEVGIPLLKALGIKRLFIYLADSKKLYKSISGLEHKLLDGQEGLKYIYIIPSNEETMSAYLPTRATYFLVKNINEIQGLIRTLEAQSNALGNQDVFDSITNSGMAFFITRVGSIDANTMINDLFNDKALSNVEKAGKVVFQVEASGDFPMEDFEKLINSVSYRLKRNDFIVAFCTNEAMTKGSHTLSLILTDFRP